MRLLQAACMSADEGDSAWSRPSRDESAAQRFARYTEGFSVEDEDAPPLPLVGLASTCDARPSACVCRSAAARGRLSSMSWELPLRHSKPALVEDPLLLTEMTCAAVSARLQADCSLALRRQALSSSTLNPNVLFVSSLPVVTLHLQNSLSVPLRNAVPAGGICNGTLRNSMQLLPATVASNYLTISQLY